MKKTVRLLMILLTVAILAACAAPTPTAPVVLIQRMIDTTPRLAISSAFDAEMSILLDKTTEKQTYVLLGRTYTTGKLEGVNVVLSLSGVSMVNAAMNTQSLLDNFTVKDLIFSGIAGGVNPDLSIGDVVIPAQWAEYQEMTFAREVDGQFVLPSWMSPSLENFGMMYPGSTSVTRKSGEPDKPTDIVWFPVDAKLMSYAEILPDTVLQKCTGDNVCLDKQPILKIGGNGVDGMTFVDNAEFRDWAWRVFKADCLAMETAAVAHVAYVNEVPFLGFRSLSDLAGGGEGENQIGTFFQLAANNSAGVVLQFVKNYAVGK